MILEFFRGDTFEFTGQLLNDLGAPVDLTAEGITVTSQVRVPASDASNRKICDVAVTLTDATHYSGLVTDTSAWPIARLECNIRYVKAGKVFSSESFQILCQRPPTQ